MGWCSGTDIFDMVVRELTTINLADDPNKLHTNIVKFVAEFILELQHNDWDCETDSFFWNSPIVREARILNDPKQGRIDQLETIIKNAQQEIRNLNAN